MKNLNEINLTESIADASAGSADAYGFLYRQTYAYSRSIAEKYLGSGAQETEAVLLNAYLEIFLQLKENMDTEAFLDLTALKVRDAAVEERIRINEQEGYYTPVVRFGEGKTAEDMRAQDYRRYVNRTARISGKEAKLKMEDILSQLSGSQRLCIVLWLDNLTIKQIGRETGMTTDEVKSNIRYANRGIERAVAMYEEQGEDLGGMAALPYLLWLSKYYNIYSLSAQAAAEAGTDAQIPSRLQNELEQRNKETHRKAHPAGAAAAAAASAAAVGIAAGGSAAAGIAAGGSAAASQEGTFAGAAAAGFSGELSANANLSENGEEKGTSDVVDAFAGMDSYIGSGSTDTSGSDDSFIDGSDGSFIGGTGSIDSSGDSGGGSFGRVPGETIGNFITENDGRAAEEGIDGGGGSFIGSSDGIDDTPGSDGVNIGSDGSYIGGSGIDDTSGSDGMGGSSGIDDTPSSDGVNIGSDGSYIGDSGIDDTSGSDGGSDGTGSTDYNSSIGGSGIDSTDGSGGTGGSSGNARIIRILIAVVCAAVIVIIVALVLGKTNTTDKTADSDDTAQAQEEASASGSTSGTDSTSGSGSTSDGTDSTDGTADGTDSTGDSTGDSTDSSSDSDSSLTQGYTPQELVEQINVACGLNYSYVGDSYYSAADENIDGIAGVIGVYLADLDQDGADEMLMFVSEDNAYDFTLEIQVYEKDENGSWTSSASLETDADEVKNGGYFERYRNMKFYLLGKYIVMETGSAGYDESDTDSWRLFEAEESTCFAYSGGTITENGGMLESLGITCRADLYGSEAQELVSVSSLHVSADSLALKGYTMSGTAADIWCVSFVDFQALEYDGNYTDSGIAFYYPSYYNNDTETVQFASNAGESITITAKGASAASAETALFSIVIDYSLLDSYHLIDDDTIDNATGFRTTGGGCLLGYSEENAWFYYRGDFAGTAAAAGGSLELYARYFLMMCDSAEIPYHCTITGASTVYPDM